MLRSIRRFVAKLHGRNKIIFFIVLALICIVALCLGIYIQFFYKYSETDPLMIGINLGSQKTAEEYAILEADFNNLFNNKILINSENVRVEKIELEKELVYTGYKLVNEDENYYSVNAQIPVMNINNNKAREINAEIKNEFYDKANSVMRQSEKNIIYKVSYAAFVNNDILSIVIKASLKEENKAEKVSVKTYNYSISNEKLLTLEELIELKKTTKEVVQKSIDDEIQKVTKNLEIIASEYGTVYERNVNSDIYKIDSAKTYFLTDDGYVYIVYAYGNEEDTNEMDIVIF